MYVVVLIANREWTHDRWHTEKSMYVMIGHMVSISILHVACPSSSLTGNNCGLNNTYCLAQRNACILQRKVLAVSVKPNASLRQMIPQSYVYWLSSEWGKAGEVSSIIMSHGLMCYFMRVEGILPAFMWDRFRNSTGHFYESEQWVGSVLALCLAVVLSLGPIHFQPHCFYTVFF